MAQFVPIKLDVDTEEYAQWRRDHNSEGNSIPKIFIVRGDGETLYGKSGALGGDELPRMLLKALQHSGKILSAKDAEILTAAADQFESLKQAGDIEGAIKSLNKIRKMGEPGKIPSYAASASRINELANQTADELKAKLKEMDTQVAGDDNEQRLQSILHYLRLRREYGGLKLIKSDLSVFQKRVTDDDNLDQIYQAARIMDSAKNAKSKSSRARAADRIRDLISTTQIEEVKSAAEKLLGELETDSDQELTNVSSV